MPAPDLDLAAGAGPFAAAPAAAALTALSPAALAPGTKGWEILSGVVLSLSPWSLVLRPCFNLGLVLSGRGLIVEFVQRPKGLPRAG